MEKMKARRINQELILVEGALVNGVHKKTTQKGTSYLIYVSNSGNKDLMFSIFENLQRPLGFTMPNKGDTISFVFKENGQYKNIDGAITITNKATVSPSSNEKYNDDLSKVGMITGACLNQACSLTTRVDGSVDFHFIERTAFELAKINIKLKKRIEDLIRNPEAKSEHVEELLGSPEPSTPPMPSTPSTPSISSEEIFNFDEGSEISL